MRVRHLGLAALAVMLLGTTAFAQERYVAFGDSLSDNGNFFAATGQPPAPYAEGRFSNGPVWVENLAGPMAGFFPPAAVNNAVSTNFAFGGARTDAAVAAPGSPPNISGGTGTQIAQFVARGGQFGPTDRVSLWGGANNLFQILPVAAGNPATATQVVAGAATQAAADIVQQAGQLHTLGARNLIVFNLPDLGSTPEAIASGPQGAQLAGLASSVYNNALAQGIRALAAATGANITLVSMDEAFAAIIANPAAFGFTNVTQSCLSQVATCLLAGPAAQNAFLFWDGVHPTAAGHRAVSAVVLQYLNAPALAGAYTVFGESVVGERKDALTRSFDRLDAVRSAVPGRNSYFVSVFGMAEDRKSGQGRPGFDSRRFGVQFGLDRAISSQVAVSFGGSIAAGSVKAGGIVSADTLTAAFDASAIYSSGPFFAKLGAGIGITRFGEIKRSTFGPLTNTGSTTGVGYHLGAELGSAHMVGSIEISPRARLAWLGGQVEAFTEAGAIAPLAIRGMTAQGLLGGLELRATAYLANSAERKVALTGLVGYERYLSYSGNRVSGVLAGNAAAPFVTAQRKPTGPGVYVGAGISAQMGGVWTVSADYRAAFGDHRQVRHTGQISLKAAF